MTPVVRYWWIPVRIVGSGFVRIEAASAEDAVSMAESGQFNIDELIGQTVESVEITGSPDRQEVS